MAFTLSSKLMSSPFEMLLEYGKMHRLRIVDLFLQLPLLNGTIIHAAMKSRDSSWLPASWFKLRR